MSGHGASPAHGPAARFRPKRLEITPGEWLVLGGDGTIERKDATGVTVDRWAVDDPAWPAHAIRFGLRAAPETVVPRGRDVPGSKPPL
jgi:hypothetical protein